MRFKALFILAGTLALGACKLDVAQPSDSPSDPATETFASSLGINISQMTKTSAGVYYKDVKVGTGTELTSPVTVVITYNGFLKNGALFDSGSQITIPLSNSVFGFQDGMMGMREGGERLIVIPSALAYGSANVQGIPPNSTLVFDVLLNQIP
ncbi:MAG TPA: FKBP-type peptidyl-prolyl cis-trans isomerase [Gemmatimonadaceae bacterium]|nr:FKBP-type peptidyl-prolyl cis-trans isomerase [Gemmatimonadaceae bacterium]